MLMVNQLIGFGVGTAGVKITGGTNIGNMTSNGGLAAVFNGVTNATSIDSAAIALTTAAYVGKTITKRVIKGIFYGSNEKGYVNVINPTITLNLRGKTGAAPSAPATDGTLLGTLSFTDTLNESGNPREIISSDPSTVWNHIWVYITHDGAANNMYFTEAEFYE